MTCIPSIDAAALLAGDAAARDAAARGATQTGFLTVHATAITATQVRELLAAYAAFFDRPAEEKARVDMAVTGANRGWGAARSEQVDPAAAPDAKEVFDCGIALPSGDPLAAQPVYAPNLWPARPEGFRQVVEGYRDRAIAVARDLLVAIADAAGEDGGYFRDKFDRPMALLRGNRYPARAPDAGARDFGIAPHTDYGCLTLLATDGTAGLEVQDRAGGWIPVTAAPGTFIINFGEMLQIWTGGRIRATPHRVIGGAEERISVPLFFNPDFEVDVAPPGSDRAILAGDHLSRRYAETYLHLAKG